MQFYLKVLYFSAGCRDFLPNVHFSFEVTRQRKLGKMKIVEVHFYRNKHKELMHFIGIKRK
jgi:hypothetical protein